MSNPEFGRILVTGGAGFIGRYVVDLLVSDGHRPLITTYKKNEKHNINFDIVEADLTDESRTLELVRSYQPQIVLHLAGVTPGHDDPDIYHRVNFVGTVNLLKALDKTGVDRVILLGSAAEYGNQPIPFREDMKLEPHSGYAISKAKANQFALDMHRKDGFPVTILRVFTAFGTGQPDKMFLSQLITHGILNRHFNMSDGLQKRDFVHVEDVAAAINAAITAENAVGRAINIAGGKGFELREIAQRVWNICGADSALLEIGGRDKAGDDSFATEADISIAAEILNWHPGAPIISDSAESAALVSTIRRMRDDLAIISGDSFYSNCQQP